jgi:hypothetical protein
MVRPTVAEGAGVGGPDKKLGHDEMNGLTAESLVIARPLTSAKHFPADVKRILFRKSISGHPERAPARIATIFAKAIRDETCQRAGRPFR